MRQAAEIVNRAKRPIIYFGGGTHTNGGRTYLQELIRQGRHSRYPYPDGRRRAELWRPHEPGHSGHARQLTSNKAVDEADVVAAIGTRFSTVLP